MFMEERPKGLLPSTSDKTMNERRIRRKAGSMSTHSCDVEWWMDGIGTFSLSKDSLSSLLVISRGKKADKNLRKQNFSMFPHLWWMSYIFMEQKERENKKTVAEKHRE